MATYAIPSTLASPSLEPRSRSSPYISPETTPRLGTGFDHDTNGSVTPKATASSPNLSLDTATSTKTFHFHTRSSSYLPGLADKLPFRTNSVEDMRKGRPRGESDLGRPTLHPRSAAAYQFPQTPVEEHKFSMYDVENEYSF